MKAVSEREHGVAGQGIYPRFGTPLRIDAVLHVANLPQHVHARELEREVAFEEGLGQRGVPHPVRGVERAVSIATAGVEVHVGAQL